MTAAEKFQNLLREDARFDGEAYNFVYEALDYTLKEVVGSSHRSQHVSGQQLLEGIRRFSIDRFGCMANAVFEAWGVRETVDFGSIVFNLVKHDLMGTEEEDRLEDFMDVYAFDEAFDVTPVFHYSRDQDEWRAQYVPAIELERQRSPVHEKRRTRDNSELL
ncbi:MAG: Minf_1886 family protein [Planctomycetota bacterium]